MPEVVFSIYIPGISIFDEACYRVLVYIDKMNIAFSKCRTIVLINPYNEHLMNANKRKVVVKGLLTHCKSWIVIP